MKAEVETGLAALLESFAKSDAQLETFGIGSQRLLKGYTGKVARLAFEALDANSGVSLVTRNQVINLPDAKGKLVPTVVAEKGKDYPVVLNLVMEDNRRVSINAIKQSPLSMIGTDQASNMVAKQWAALAGKSITLDDTGDDDDTTIRRPGNDGKLEARVARFFKFTVTE